MKKRLLYLSLFVLTLIYFGCRKDEDPVPVVDTTPPTAVEDVKNELVLNKDKTVIDTLKLSWEPSTDASGVVKYTVNLLMYDENGVPKKIRSVESDTPSASFLTLSNSKDYKVEVQTLDPSGNGSNKVLKDLTERTPFNLKVGGNELTFDWVVATNTEDKVSNVVTISKYANGNESTKTEVVSETIELYGVSECRMLITKLQYALS